MTAAATDATKLVTNCRYSLHVHGLGMGHCLQIAASSNQLQAHALEVAAYEHIPRKAVEVPRMHRSGKAGVNTIRLS